MTLQMYDFFLIFIEINVFFFYLSKYSKVNPLIYNG